MKYGSSEFIRLINCINKSQFFSFHTYFCAEIL